VSKPEASTKAPAKILIADDNPDSRRLLALLLKPEGHHLLLAADGQEALRVVDATPDLSLVLLDVMMPGMDGLEVCRQIRSRKGYVPIILVTALSDEGNVSAGLAAGADDYVTKPLNHTQVLARVRAALRLKGALDQLVESSELAAVAAMQVTLAHEINNPLAIAQGNIELLLNSTPPDHPNHDRLKAAFEACVRIRELVQRLVEMKKVVTKTYLGSVRMLNVDLTEPPKPQS